jgi:5-methylcytosine-specific restriction endonuclease McrA
MANEKTRKKQRKYANASPCKYRHVIKASNANYRARKHGVPGSVTSKDLSILFKKYRFCLMCGKEYNLTVDHIKAMSKGGINKLENLQVLCSTCNHKKKQYDVDCRKTLDDI